MWALVTFWLSFFSSQGAKSQTHLDTFLFLHSVLSWFSFDNNGGFFGSASSRVGPVPLGRACKSLVLAGLVGCDDGAGHSGTTLMGMTPAWCLGGLSPTVFRRFHYLVWAGSWLLSSILGFKPCPLLYCIVLYTTRLRTEKTSGACSNQVLFFCHVDVESPPLNEPATVSLDATLSHKS